MSAGYVIYSLDSRKFQRFVEQPTAAQLAVVAENLKYGWEEYEDEFDKNDPVLKWPKSKKGLATVAGKRLAQPDWYGDLSYEGKTVWEQAIFNTIFHGLDVDFQGAHCAVYWNVIEVANERLGITTSEISDRVLAAFGRYPFRYFPKRIPQSAKADLQKSRVEQNASSETPKASNDDEYYRKLAEITGDWKNNRISRDEARRAIEALSELLGPDDDESDANNESEAEDESDNDYWTAMHSMHSVRDVSKMIEELTSIEKALLTSKVEGVKGQYQNDLLPELKRIAAEGRMLLIQVDS